MGQEAASNPNNHLDAVFHILHAGNSSSLPSVAEMDAWVNTYGLENATLASKDAQATLDALEQRECTYLVNTDDMTVVWKDCSCTNGACTPSVAEGLNQLDMALP